MLYDQHGNEAYSSMMMNGIIVDEFSPEFINSTRKIIIFSTAAMLPALSEIEKVYNEYSEEEVQTFRNKGPFHVLEKSNKSTSNCKTCCF